MRTIAALAFLVAGCGCGDDEKPHRHGGDDAGTGDDGGPPNPCDGGDPIVCPDDVRAACTGPATEVDVGAAEVGCDALGAPENDAPAGGFGVGETTVTFTTEAEDGARFDCTTTITITDDGAPVVDCPTDATLVRTAPEEVLVAPTPPVSDDCDDAPALEVPPDPLPTGTTRVEYRATDDAGNVGTCATDVRVVELYAPGTPRIASAQLEADGTTSLTVAWEKSVSTVGGYRVERADDAAGPWAGIADETADDQFHTDAPMGADQEWYRIRSVSGALEGGATAPLHAWAIESASYDVRGVSVPTVPFSTTLYGVVRHPRDLAAGPYPLVLLLHGNHGNCRPAGGGDDECADTTDGDCPWGGYTTTPNAEGLAYLAETLAAQGHVAVSVSANALNCRDDYIVERAELLLEHLRRWKDWNAAAAAPFDDTFVGTLDLSRVGLVGHSRGGEAVAHVPSRLAATPIAGVTIGSVFSIAPVDFHGPVVGDVPYAVLLPACDGDVYTLEGMRIYDRSVRPSDEVPRSQVFIEGANHNFFSTEWRFDDNVGYWLCDASVEIGADAQQAMLETTLGSWFGGTLDGAALEPFERADGDTPTAIDAWAGEDLELRWSHAAAERLSIDALEGAGSPGVNLLGGANTFSEFTDAIRCTSLGCDDSFFHEKSGILFRWEGRTPVATWNLEGLDATGWGWLSFRVVSRLSTLNDGLEDQDFTIRVMDADGDLVEMPLSGARRIEHLYSSNYWWEVLQTVRVPLEDLPAENPAIDLASLDVFELEMTTPGHLTGSVIVTDVELAR